MAGLVPFNRRNNDLMSTGFEDFHNMLDDFFTNSWPLRRSLAGDTFKIDIQDNEKEYVVEAELPGIQKNDVNVSMEEGRLIISVNNSTFAAGNWEISLDVIGQGRHPVV